MSGSAALIRCGIRKDIDKQNPFDMFIIGFGKQVVIGRDQSSDFRIDSIEVSRRHAIIETIGHNWFVTDLESTNGLYLNDTQMTEFTPYCLKNGDKLSFGPSNRSKFVYKFVCNECPIKPFINPLKRKNEKSSESESKRIRSEEFEELLDSELSCAICHELFVTPITLNCSHTFCYSCIEEWKGSKNFDHKTDNTLSPESETTNCCPICRQPIVSQNRVLVLDTVIDSLVKLTPELWQHRKELIDERKRRFQ